MNDYNLKKVVISNGYYKSEPRKIAGLFNGEISWQHKVSITQLNSVKSWIKAFQKNKKAQHGRLGKLTRYQSKCSDSYLV